MKRVEIYEPELKKTQKGRNVVTEIVKKEGKLLEERSIMDRTFDLAERGGNDWIIANKKYFKEVPMPKEEKKGAAKKEIDLNKPVDEMTANELSAKAEELGLAKSGTKAELLERINEHLAGETPANEE